MQGQGKIHERGKSIGMLEGGKGQHAVNMLAKGDVAHVEARKVRSHRALMVMVRNLGLNPGAVASHWTSAVQQRWKSNNHHPLRYPGSELSFISPFPSH